MREAKYFSMDTTKRRKGPAIKKIYDENFNEIGTFEFTNEVEGLTQITKDRFLAKIWKGIYEEVKANEYGYYVEGEC